MENESVSFDFIGGKDVMPITGYYGPHPHFHSEEKFADLFSDDIFKKIAEAGIRLIVYSHTDYSRDPDLVKRMLDLGEKYGVGIFVLDEAVLAQKGKAEVDVDALKKQISNYSDHPAFCGMYLIDEPQTSYFLPGNESRYISQYAGLAKALQYDLGHICYMNMFPVWNLAVNRDIHTRYVEEFVDSLDPRVLMWDKYPFSTGDPLSVVFYNMDCVRAYSKKMGRPFWAFVQAGAQWNDEKKHFDSTLPYYPNEGQFNWNVNTCLAFGAKGIQYFPLCQPEHFAYAETVEWDSERNGIIGVFGNETQWHGYAKKINAHIGVIDEVLMNASNEGVIVSGDKAKEDTALVTCIVESGSFRQLTSVSGDAMVGCFDYQGKTALYVVNYSMDGDQSIALTLDATYDITVMKNAAVSHERTAHPVLDMSPGEGVLLVLSA